MDVETASVEQRIDAQFDRLDERFDHLEAVLTRRMIAIMAVSGLVSTAWLVALLLLL
jgi:hypothetical protein